MERQGVIQQIKRYATGFIGPPGPAGPAAGNYRAWALSGARPPASGIEPPRSQAFRADAAAATTLLTVAGPTDTTFAAWARVPTDEFGTEGVAVRVRCATGSLTLEWDAAGPSGPALRCGGNLVGPFVLSERGAWVLVGWTRKSLGVWAFWVNGVEVGTLAWPGGTGAPAEIFMMANSASVEDQAFPGTMRNPAIWQGALSADAWASLATAGPSADWRGTIGSYAEAESLLRYWPGPAVPVLPLSNPVVVTLPDLVADAGDLEATGATASNLRVVSVDELEAETSYDLATLAIIAQNTRAQSDQLYRAWLQEWFGDASDGNLTLSSSVFTGGPLFAGALIQDGNYNVLTIVAGGQISAPQGRLFCRVLDLSNAPASAIISAGGDAASSVGGVTLPGKTVGASQVGGTGAAGGTANGSQAGALSTNISNGGPVGSGGAGGNGASGTGGVARTAPAQTTTPFRRPVIDRIVVGSSTGACFWLGGCSGVGGGGGGGDGAAGGLGGGGGSGARPIQIFAATIITSGATPAAVIASVGGNGAAGAQSAGGTNTGGGGGGAGGGGADITVIYAERTGSAVTNLARSTGGNGGGGGPPRGTGTAGTPGTGGGGGEIIAFRIGGTLPAAVVAARAAAGGQSGAVTQVTF